MTLADATTTGHHLGHPLADQVARAASHAFTASLHSIAALAAVATLLVALLAGLLLRRSPRVAGPA